MHSHVYHINNDVGVVYSRTQGINYGHHNGIKNPPMDIKIVILVKN